MGKRIKTLLLIGIGILLAFQWPPGPGNTAATDIPLLLSIIYVWPTFWKHREIIRFPLMLPQWMIFLGGLTATLGSLDQTASLMAIVQDVYIYLWFLSLVNMIDDEADFHKIRKAWVLMACLEGLLLVLTVLGIGRTLFVKPLQAKGKPIPGTAGQSGRTMGTIGHPNATGTYMRSSFFVLLSICHPQKTWQRVLIGLLLFAGILTTGSRGAIVAWLIGMFVMLAYQIARSGGKSPLFWGSVAASLAGVACLVAIVGVPSSIIAFTQGTFLRHSLGRLMGASIPYRTFILKGAWKAYRSHPLGIGPNAFGAWLGGSLGEGSMHSDYLSHLVERGPLGFIGLLLLVTEVLLCLKSSMALTKDDPSKQFQVLALGAGFLGSAALELVYDIMHNRTHWLLITLIFAQNGLLRARYSQERTPGGLGDRRPAPYLVHSPLQIRDE